MLDNTLRDRRIVFIAEGFGPEPDTIGGAGKLLRSIALESRAHGAVPSVVVDSFVRGAPGQDSWMRDGLEVRKFPLVRSIPASATPFGRTHRREIRAWLALPRIARAIQSDIVNLHIHPNGLIRFAHELKRRTGTKVVVSTHGLDVIVHNSARYDRAAMKKGWREAIEGVDVWVPCGPLDHRGLVEWGIPEEKITPIYNGVDVPPTLTAVDRDGEVKHAPWILYLGRVMEKKGILDLADAVVEMTRRDESVRPHLEIVGSCPDDLRATIVERLAAGGERLTYDLVGEVPAERVPEFITRADIFCHPTKGPEGLPLSVLEAGANGCPMVLSEHPSHRAFAADEPVALFYRAGDPSDLASALARIASDRGLRDSLRREAHRLVAERYNHRRMLAEYMALYARLAGDRR